MIWPRWPMASVTEVKPCARSCRRTISRMDISPPIGTSGFGIEVVYGRRRTPCPPARMTACLPSSIMFFSFEELERGPCWVDVEGGRSDVVDVGLVAGEIGRFGEPFGCPAQTFPQR